MWNLSDPKFACQYGFFEDGTGIEFDNVATDLKCCCSIFFPITWNYKK